MSTFMNCTRCEICVAALNIYASLSFIHLSLLFRLLLEPICTLGILLLTIAVFQTSTLHYNARLLLICMTISVMVSNIGVLLDAMYKLLISFVLPEEIRCDYQVYKPQYLFTLRKIHIVGGLGLALSTMLLAVERVLATVTYVTYEKNGRRWVGITLTLIQARFPCHFEHGIIVVALICIGIGLRVHPPQQFYPYVTPDTINSERSKTFGNIIYGLNIIALVVFTVLYIVNRRRKRSLTDSQLRVLSTRFQLKENIATTRLMAPVMLVVALITTSSQWVYYFHLPDLDEQTIVTSAVLEQVSNFAPYSEYQLSLMPPLTLLLVVLLPCFNLQIKRSFVRISHLRVCFPEPPSSIDTVTVDEARDLYFAKLKGQWRESPTPRAQI